MTNMKANRFIAVISLALVVALGVSHLSAQSGYDLFQKALAKERADGNLPEAIQLYQRVVKQFASDRALVAKALVQMAECYQKLGDAQARKIYEQLVREYADQKEAVTLARVRLAAAGAVASAKGDRAVWTGPKVYGASRVSPDGRFITGIDQNGSLFVHDVGANVDRVLTPPLPKQWADDSAISRDGKQVAYVWWDQNNRLGLRIAALQGTGFPETRQFFLAHDDIRVFRALDWSPDGKWIAVPLVRKDGTGQIALITVADGSLRVLKSIMRSNLPNRTFFSPDSKYIAYDIPAGDGVVQRDVSVLAVDGGRNIPAVVHSANDAVMGWSPDGTRLLFSSDRTGSVGLWAQPFANGTMHGAPELLKADIGPSVSLGLTASGAMYVHKRISGRDIAIAPIDLEAGKLLGPPVSFTQGFVEGAKNPTWSPDGRYLAYPLLGCNVVGLNGCDIAIRSVSTGQVRLLPRTLSEVASAHLDWSPDGRSLLTKAIDLRGRTGVFQIDTQSGEATAVVLGDGLAGFTQWSRDGQKVYFTRRGGLVERDLASGVEREVNREFGGRLTPDGRYFATARRNTYPNPTSILLVPVAGGEPREFELLRLTPPEVIGFHSEWTPDSSGMIITKNSGSHRELWLIPVMGGRPRKLDIDPNIWMEGSARPGEATGDQGFILSPDGRRIAFLMGKSVLEVWALENFLPAGTVKK